MRITRILALCALMLPSAAIGYYFGAANTRASTIAVYPPAECSQEEVVEPTSI